MAAFKNEKTLDVGKEERELSESDDEDLDVLPGGEEEHDGPDGKALSFNHTDSFQFSRDIIIGDGEAPVYYADVSDFTRHKPDITLHKGDKDGPVVAASFFGWGKFRLGLGSDDISMVWTELKRGGSFMSKRYTFEWKGKPYMLLRAKSEDTRVTGWSRLMLTHFKVVQADSGEILALYISNKIGKKKGTMRLKSGLAEDLEILCVLSVASWRDKIRREQPKGGGGG
jgi:hypothetical protein